MPRGRLGTARAAWRASLVLAGLIYAFILAVGPLLHHDLACELKSRTHCTVCVAGIAGPGLAEPAAPPMLDSPRAASLPIVSGPRLSDTSIQSITGRSPPAA